MAITDIVSDIAGVGPTANYTLGANTEAPYAGVSILALTDGSSAATASKNMAKIDTRYLFERRYTIEKAGLTYDPLDDSQFVRALQKLPNISPASFATFPSTGRPTNTPSVADPAIVKTNTNGEVFMYNGTSWIYVGGGVNLLTGDFPFIVDGTADLSSAVQIGTPTTITNPSATRTMVLDIDGYSEFFNFLQPNVGYAFTRVYINNTPNQHINYTTVNKVGANYDHLLGSAVRFTPIQIPPSSSITVGFSSGSNAIAPSLITVTSANHSYKFSCTFIG